MGQRKVSTSASTQKASLPPLPFHNTSTTPISNKMTTPSKDTTSSSKPSSSKDKSPKSKIITLKLSPATLAKFPHEKARVKSEAASTSSSSTPANTSSTEKKAVTTSSDTPAAPTPSPIGADTPVGDASTPAATSNGMLAPPTKTKGVPGRKPGLKRTASQLEGGSGTPKARGKPGPKKKARVGENGEALPPTALTAAEKKLGPKANAGAINACLRALDRTGKPCRKWQKKPFAVRSFTGYQWGAGTYATLQDSKDSSFAGDVKSDTSETRTQEEGSGDKPAGSSGDSVDTPMANGVSTPQPVAAAA